MSSTVERPCHRSANVLTKPYSLLVTFKSCAYLQIEQITIIYDGKSGLGVFPGEVTETQRPPWQGQRVGKMDETRKIVRSKQIGSSSHEE